MTTHGAPRVWHVIPRDGIGGVEVAARSMLARDNLECQFELLSIAGGGQPIRDEVPHSTTASLYNPVSHLYCLKKIITARPDVVIFSLWWSVPVALALRLSRPRAKIVYFLNIDRPTHLIDKLLTRLGVLVADEVWGDSSATLNNRLSTDPTPRRCISFVTDRLPVVNQEELPKPHFIAWARLNRQKGFDRAIEFIASLVRRGVDARFDIWGRDDGELANLQTLVFDQGLGDRVRFRGPFNHRDLAGVASSASFFLQPSRSEGMSMACVEAMQMGLVPIVTAVGEMKNYVCHQHSGIILDVADLDKAASEVLSLINQPERYRQVRNAAVSHWSSPPLYADDVCSASASLLRTSKQ